MSKSKSRTLKQAPAGKQALASKKTSPPPKFTLFPLLPRELRNQIWEAAFPSQTLTIDPAFQSIHRLRDSLAPPSIPEPPTTLSINRESRYETLLRYAILPVPVTTISAEGKRHLEHLGGGRNARKMLHFDCSSATCPEHGDRRWSHFARETQMIYFNPSVDVLDLNIRSITRDAHHLPSDEFSSSRFMTELVSWFGSLPRDRRGRQLGLARVRNVQITDVDLSALFLFSKSEGGGLVENKKHGWMLWALELFTGLQSVCFRELTMDAVLDVKGWSPEAVKEHKEVVLKARGGIGGLLEKKNIESRFEEV